MQKILCIDYGEKRIGLAISDPLGLTAQPFSVINRKSLENDLEIIKSVVKDNNISKIIIGLPLNMDGSEGIQTKNVREFGDFIADKMKITVEFFDERLTTIQAEKMLIEQADLSRNKRKNVRDKLAACLILQAYLDQLKK